jgi:hypothetical protein
MLDARNKSIVCFCFATIGIIMLSGCKSYTTPGAGADMSVFVGKELVTVPTGESIAALQGFPEYRTGDNQDSTIEIMKRKPTDPAQTEVMVMVTIVLLPYVTLKRMKISTG